MGKKQPRLSNYNAESTSNDRMLHGREAIYEMNSKSAGSSMTAEMLKGSHVVSVRMTTGLINTIVKEGSVPDGGVEE